MTRNIAPEKYLRNLGYSGPLDEMAANFQAFNGLRVSGYLDRPTIQLLNNPLRCGMPDQLGQGDCRWQFNDVRWFADIALRQFSAERALEIYADTLAEISSVCGLRFVQASVQGQAHFIATGGRGRRHDFDGPGGVLGWSEMPCGPFQRALQQMYDQDEDWVEWLIRTTMLHENCHVVGVPHGPAGNLMAPYVDQRIRTLQAWDKAELVRRYGPPTTSPVDPPPGPVEGLASVEVMLGGRLFKGVADLKPAD